MPEPLPTLMSVFVAAPKTRAVLGPAPGRPAGFQLLASPHWPLTAPVQVWAAADGARIKTAPRARMVRRSNRRLANWMRMGDPGKRGAAGRTVSCVNCAAVRVGDKSAGEFYHWPK